MSTTKYIKLSRKIENRKENVENMIRINKSILAVRTKSLYDKKQHYHSET